MTPEEFVARVFASAGGPERVREIIDGTLRDFDQAWDRDTDLIGRLLRAHLVVEHFMTECLRSANPRLGSLEAARITFAQKVALLDDQDRLIVALRPGIMALNAIRNRLAHRLAGPLQHSDVAPLLTIEEFRVFRERAMTRGQDSGEPITVLEDFARFAAGCMQSKSSEFGRLIAEALKVRS